MGRIGSKSTMQLSNIFVLVASAFAGGQTCTENCAIYNEDGNVAYVDSTERGVFPSREDFVQPKGPRECMGKKIPEIKNGYFICHRNLNNSGNKKGKKKKCRFHCDKGWIVSTKKAKGKGKDGVIKCHSQKGWLTKPKKLMCVRKH